MSADETRRRILEEAIGVIDDGGEDSLRVADVARRAGVTQGMVTYHFGTRHQLVAEAQLERYASTMSLDIKVLTSIVDTIHDVDTLLEVGRRFTEQLFTPDRVMARRARINAIGFALGDEEVRAQLQRAATESVGEFAAFFEVLAGRGLLRPGVSPRAAATVITAYSIGLVQWDLDEEPAPAGEVAEVINTFLRSITRP